ncbi:EamA family transporter [Nocardioides anomalus]|uniref:EamA family transporter n=1 Tax=Nocardioides anomalus TaxID=2712223 RepID=A0A6G6WCN8_9ACTN|nr:EamA family transporter [Nocardioides anomalus]QIG42917.1 EamA family transporter [Nocardioides anomalus]
MHLDPGPLVVVLVLIAAVMHATWNAIAHAATDRLVGFALLCTSAFALGAVLVVTGGPIDGHHLALAALSAALHVAYMLLLWASYEHGDLSRSYPIARGTGVALTAVASFFAPRSPLGPDVVVGVALVVAGLLGVTLVGGRGPGRGLAAALGTGAAIAGYTVVDGLAVSGGAPVVAYAGWLFLLQSWVLPLVAVVRRGRRLRQVERRQVLLGLTGGAVSLLAYGLVLVAQTSGALAAIAALRELSIAVGVVIGAFVLHEQAARRRLLPAVAITAGAVVLAFSL